MTELHRKKNAEIYDSSIIIHGAFRIDNIDNLLVRSLP